MRKVLIFGATPEYIGKNLAFLSQTIVLSDHLDLIVGHSGVLIGHLTLSLSFKLPLK